MRAGLRRKSQGYLITGMKSGKPVAQIDPDFTADAEAVAGEIEACKALISGLESKIGAVDGILFRHGIDRPVLVDMVREKGFLERGVMKYKQRVAATLAHCLQMTLDEEAAKQHRDYSEAVADYETRRNRSEPKISELEKAIDEVKA